MMKKVRTGILMGLGAASLAKKEVEKSVKMLIKAEKISSKEGAVLVNKLVDEGIKQQKSIKKFVDCELDKLGKVKKK